MAGTDGEIDALFKEKMGQDKFVTDAMRRGSDMEKEALAAYEAEYDIKFERPVAVHDEHDWLLASFDGFNFDQKISIEIKCPNQVPDDLRAWKWWNRYYWQVQAQLAVGGHYTSIFMVYSPTKRIDTIIQRNDEDIASLIKQGAWFYEFMKMGISPSTVSKKGSDWDEAAAEVLLAKEQAKMADLKVQEKERILKALSNEESSEGQFYRYLKTEMPGRIAYTKIPELKGINLDLYRGKPFETWKLSKI